MRGRRVRYCFLLNPKRHLLPGGRKRGEEDEETNEDEKALLAALANAAGYQFVSYRIAGLLRIYADWSDTVGSVRFRRHFRLWPGGIWATFLFSY